VSEQQPTVISDGQLDFRELILLLWHNKLRIILITVLCTALAVIYAFTATPVYQATAVVMPPTSADLAEYNQIADLDLQSSRIKPADAFAVFRSFARSRSLRFDFFEQYYLPEAEEQSGETFDEAEIESLWVKFNKDLNIQLDKQDGIEQLEISMQSTSPVRAARWTNRFLDEVLTRGRDQLLDNLQSRVKVQTEAVTVRIEALRHEAEVQRAARMQRLKDALHLARSIELNEPPMSGNLVTSYQGETAYLRGAKALEAEIAILDARDDNDPYIEGLPELQQQLAVLEKVNVMPEHLTVATVDSLAVPPVKPIKPEKKLIAAVGLLLGLMISVFWVLVRHAFKAG